MSENTQALEELFNQESNLEVPEYFENNTVEVPNIPSSNEDEEDIPFVDADLEKLKSLQEEQFLPTGTYVWMNTPKVVANYNENDKQPSDIMQKLYLATGNSKYDKGRMFINVSGVVKSTSSDRKGFFKFSFSPDVRYFNGGEQSDMQSKTYSNLCNFYYQKHEKQVAQEPKDVNDMLKSCNYGMYITLSKNSDANYLGNLRKL